MSKLYPRFRLKNRRFFLALFLCLVSFYSGAATLTFITRQSGNFSDPNTWSSGTVPGPQDKIVVQKGHILRIDVNTPALGQVNILDGGELRGDGTGKVLSLGSSHGHDLKNYGTINFSGDYAATIKLANDGKWSGTGIYNLTDIDLNQKALDFTSNGKYTLNLSGATPISNPGTLDGKSMIVFRFNGNVPQTLPTHKGLQYGGIEIANPAGVYLDGDLGSKNLLAHLTVAKGFLHMNGYQIQGRPGASIGGQTLRLEPETLLIVDETSAFPASFHNYLLDHTSTVRYSGGKSQTVKALNYGNLEILGKRAGSTVSFEPGLTGVSNALVASATFTGGGYAPGTSILALNGPGNQALDLENTALKLNGLAVSGGGIKSLAGAQNLVAKNLVLQNGLLATSQHTEVRILPGGSVTGASSKSYVSGNLTKQVPQGLKVAMTYEIGDEAGYNPLALTFPAVVTSGMVTAGLFPAATGDQLGTRIKPERRVDKTWKITHEGLAPAVYSTTFNFTEQEIQGGSMDNFEVNVFSPLGYERIRQCELTNTSVTITNASAFGYVQIGEYNKVEVNARIFLQGAYVSGKKMRVSLTNVLPLTQPFAAIYDYHGNEAIAAGLLGPNNPIVDWVMLELRSPSNPKTVIARKACLLREDGQLVETDGSTFPAFFDLKPGDFYVVIRHRNHLAVMSAQPLALNDVSEFYDFSTGPGQYYGNQAAVLGGGVYGMYGGDANGSAFITVTDHLPINQSLNLSGYLPGDLDLSGVVNNLDRSIISKSFYRVSLVP